MKYAICILAHNKPDLLNKIVDRLSSNNTEIFIHLDSKCLLKDYSNIKNAKFIEKRVHVNWGGRSMIGAMCNLIEYVVNHSSCQYLMFLSGQDFPVVYPKDYDTFIDSSKNYIQHEMLPRKCWYMGGLDRVRYFYFFSSPNSLFSRAIVKVQKLLKIARCAPFSIYGGSQWININLDAARYILTNWKAYYKFFKFSLIPDEMFFQTILLNSPLKETVINNNYRFIIHKAGELHPQYLSIEHIDDILDSDTLFCRKIKDLDGFEKIETKINRRAI